jgi:GDPmannose 4,6-dehydratase
MRALITGITGQDGAYLAEFLLDKGYQVFGTYRRLSTPNFWRLQYLGIFEKVTLIPADLLDASSIFEAIKLSEPDEIYHLAAQSFVGASFEQPVGAGEITGLGVTRILEAIREINPRIRFYQASTSELFGNGHQQPQTETSPFRPASPYAASKIYGYWITKIYREGYGIFACNGILFNHESPLRGMEFVTRKVSNTVAKIALGIGDQLSLGNTESRRDWGYAPEYVETMWLMLQQDEPDDYVIATGITTKIRDFVRYVFAEIGIEIEFRGQGVEEKGYIKSCNNPEFRLEKGKEVLRVDPRYFRPTEVDLLIGDPTKAKTKLGWEPQYDLKGLIKDMITSDLKLMKKEQYLKNGGHKTMNYFE